MKNTNREVLADLLKCNGTTFSHVLKMLTRSPLEYMDWDAWLDSTDPGPVYKNVKKAVYTNYDGAKHDCFLVGKSKMFGEDYATVIISEGNSLLSSDFDDTLVKVPAKEVIIDEEKNG